MSKTFEIERKFLIKMPDISLLTENKECKSVYIMQTYLKDKTRIRKLETDNKAVYIKTIKRKISDITRIEEENEISKKEYDELFKFADPDRQTITKTRYKYPFMNKVLEIDIFPFWSDRAFLEIELKSENENFSIPPFIEIIKEVTPKPQYTNYSLAKQIPNEKI